MNNESSGQSAEELTERAVQSIARVWGVSEDEARAAIARCRDREGRLTPEVARNQIWTDHHATVIDLTDPATRAAYYEQTA